jgi:hypothetical protein
VQVGGDYNQKRCRVHAWAFKFFPCDVYGGITNRLGSSNKVSGVFKSTLFNFAQWKNLYLSNRQLSDENRYIMERKLQEKTIGNFLEKPTVLLKRNYIRDTSFNEEQLAAGSNYDRFEVQAQSMARDMASGSAPPPPPGGFARLGAPTRIPNP